MELLCPLIMIVLFVVVPMVGLWKLYEKAGQPGWAAIVPIYNYIILMKIVNRPTWWVLPCLFVPFFGIIPLIDLAKSFGKDTGYAIGMIFLSFIFIPMLGFSNAVYTPIERPPGQGNA